MLSPAIIETMRRDFIVQIIPYLNLEYIEIWTLEFNSESIDMAPYAAVRGLGHIERIDESVHGNAAAVQLLRAQS